MRQIVLDTETTGLETSQDHRIIEIGCVEMVNRKLTGRHYHQYINPQRKVDEGAMEVHGITDQFLEDKPLFDAIAPEFFEFVTGADLIIHNAPFDLGFINHETAKLPGNIAAIETGCKIIDTLALARQKHPGQKNNLDALCKRYGVDNTQRQLHGALLDAEILADVYLVMTSGQSSLLLSEDESEGSNRRRRNKKHNVQREKIAVINAGDDELAAHEQRLQDLAESSDEGCLWLQLEAEAQSQ